MQFISQRAVDAIFIIAWLFPVLLVSVHFTRMKRKRLPEIRETFFSGELDPKTWYADHGSILAHPAAEYLFGRGNAVNARNIAADATDALSRAIDERFHRYQGLGRYVIPTVLMLSVSACGLWLCREWVHERWFPPVATSVPSARAAGAAAVLGGAKAPAAATSGAAPPAAAPPATAIDASSKQKNFPNTISEAILMAFAGAYVWGAWELIRRSHESNLTPEEVYDCAFRWLVAVPVGYAFSLLAGETFQPAIAFAATVFPLKDVQRVAREWQIRKLAGTVSTTETRPQEQPLRTWSDGVSDATLARLEELDVRTALDMAYADPILLMTKTGCSILQVLEWIDQALLGVYTAELKPKFVKLGLRCATDVVEFIQDHVRPPADTGDQSLLAHIAGELCMPVSAARDLLLRIDSDPQVRRVFQLWRARQNQCAHEHSLPNAVSQTIEPDALVA